MLAQALQKVFGKEHLVKNQLIPPPRQGNLLQRNIIQWSIKPLIASQNRVEVS
jgi:hypothetical protein